MAARFGEMLLPLKVQMAGDGAVWRRVAERNRFVEARPGLLASASHTDADFKRSIDVVTDMSKLPAVRIY